MTIHGSGALSEAAGEPFMGIPSLEEVLERDAARLLALAYSIVRDRDQARDVVQDTMERAFRSRSTLRDPSRCSAWLSTICVREARRVLGRQRLHRLVPWLSNDAPTAPQGPDVDLERCLHRLPPRQRSVVALHYVYGYTLDETAAVLGCRPGTARQHLHRALGALRKELEP